MKTNFVKVRCKCKNEQIVFDKSSTVVKCLVCNEDLLKPTGGKAEIVGRVLEVLN
jgi:small subunit ribosomal protein S27e